MDQGSNRNKNDSPKESMSNEEKVSRSLDADAAMSNSVAPANAAVLLTTTFAGAAITTAGDIFGSSLPDYAFGVFAGAWVLAIVVTLYRIGRDVVDQNSTSIKVHIACIKKGWQRALQKKIFAVILLIMSLFGTYSAWAQYRQKGDLAAVSINIDKVLVTTDQTAKDMVNVVESLLSDQAALRNMGYGPTEDDAWRALGAGDVEALRLMRKLDRQNFPVFSNGSTSALEILILRHTADIFNSLEIARIESKYLNQPHHIEKSYTGEFKVPEKNGLFESLGFTMVRVIPPPDKMGSKVYLTINNDPWMAEVPPLLLAVWAKNEDAVEALLKNGADPDASSILTLNLIGASRLSPVQTYDINVSALSESRRLGLKSAESALVAAGAKTLSKAELIR